MVLLAHHRATRAAGRDYVVVRGVLEDLDEPLGELLGLIVKPVIEERLAAAGLRFGEMNGATEVLEDLRHRDTDARVELIGQAGDEEGDVTGHASSPPSRGARGGGRGGAFRVNARLGAKKALTPTLSRST